MGRRIDPRAMMRQASRTGGELILPKFRSAREVHPPLVVLADISGSMSQYTRIFLHFLHALTEKRRRVHTFVFGTRLTNLTRQMRHRDPDDALADCSAAVKDWSGGTRIGDTLNEFNRLWSRRVLGQGAVVLLSVADYSNTCQQRYVLLSLRHTLDSFVGIGLGYLTPGPADADAVRRRGAAAEDGPAPGIDLTGMTYIFDEPSVGLHPHDVGRLNDLLLRLRDKGNTVLVVEHEPDVDRDRRPHRRARTAGRSAGGDRSCFEGTPRRLRTAGTLTGRHLDDRRRVKRRADGPPARWDPRRQGLHNLRDVDVDVPLGVLAVVTGVAGSGKSSLIHGSVRAGTGVVSVDQGAIRGSRRSNPATYSG